MKYWFLICLIMASGLCGCSVTEMSHHRTGTDMQGIAAGLSQFKLLAGRYPTEGEGLEALVVRPEGLHAKMEWAAILRSVPLDPWGNEYGYIVSDSYEEGFGLYSMGRDGVSGSRGNDADDWNTWSENSQHDREYDDGWGWEVLVGSGVVVGVSVLVWVYRFKVVGGSQSRGEGG